LGADHPFVRESKSDKKGGKKSPESETGASLRKGQQPRWADKKPKKGKEEKKAPSGPRIIIFVLGGVSYSEVRATYELSNKLNRQITIGTNSEICR
jgi:syntaxin-binding protein 1